MTTFKLLCAIALTVAILGYAVWAMNGRRWPRKYMEQGPSFWQSARRFNGQ